MGEEGNSAKPDHTTLNTQSNKSSSSTTHSSITVRHANMTTNKEATSISKERKLPKQILEKETLKKTAKRVVQAIVDYNRIQSKHIKFPKFLDGTVRAFYVQTCISKQFA